MTTAMLAQMNRQAEIVAMWRRLTASGNTAGVCERLAESFGMNLRQVARIIRDHERGTLTCFGRRVKVPA